MKNDFWGTFVIGGMLAAAVFFALHSRGWE